MLDVCCQEPTERVIQLKKSVAVLSVILLLFTLVLWTSYPGDALAARTATVNVSVLNVRSGPGTEYAKISEVTSGTMLPVLEERSGWVRVTLADGSSGWVSSSYVTLQNTAPAVVSPTLAAKVTTDVLNVRQGPGTQYNRLTTVTKDTVLPVIKNQGSWLQVKLPGGETGWISGDYAMLLEVPAAQPAPVDTPATQTPPVSNIPNVPAPVEVANTAVVNVNVLNVRSGPGTDFQIMTTVTRDTRLTVLKQQGDWLNVALPNGQVGWIFATYATLAENGQAQGETKIQRLATVNVSALNARSAPTTEAERLALLPRGATVKVIGEQDDWLQVELVSGETAWIAGWFVDISTVELPAVPGNPGGSADIDFVDNKPSSLWGKVIFIDAGHGGSNSGAIGVTGLYEKVVNLDVALRLAAKLRQAGAVVVMARETDITLSLNERVAKAERSGAHVFVSIHTNAHPNRSVSGTETYYYRGRPGDVESYYLAAHLQTELVKALGLRDIGVKHGNLHVIRETTMPAALVELAFLSNPYDESLLKTESFRDNAATAIYRGLERYFSQR